MSMKLTNAGKQLLLQAMAGNATLRFLSIQLGNGADATRSATALSNPMMTLEITGYESTENGLTLEAAYSGQDVEVTFSATELGVVAEDPEVEGGTVLYAYQYTPEAGADRIRSGQEVDTETQMLVDVYVGDAEGVEVVLAKPGENVTRTEFEAFAARRDNPHEVTAEQVGLGKVQNAEPENMTVKFREVSQDGEIQNIKSGENLGLSLGKVKRVLQAIFQHFDGENPHEITPELIQAAHEKHVHSAADMTTGVLGIQRGGTGGSTAREAREKLGIRAGQCRLELTAGQAALVEVKFGAPYGALEMPFVVLTPMMGTIRTLQLGVQARSSTGFTVFAYSPDFSGTVSVNWIACL